MKRKRLYEKPALHSVALEAPGLLVQSESRNAQSIERAKLVDFDFDDPFATDNEDNED